MSPRQWLSWALARIRSDFRANADGRAEELPREGAGQQQFYLLVPFARKPWLEGLSLEFPPLSLGSDWGKALGGRYPLKAVQGQSPGERQQELSALAPSVWDPQRRAEIAPPGRTSQPTLLQQILGFEGNKYTQYISVKMTTFF